MNRHVDMNSSAVSVGELTFDFNFQRLAQVNLEFRKFQNGSRTRYLGAFFFASSVSVTGVVR